MLVTPGGERVNGTALLELNMLASFSLSFNFSYL